MVFFFSTKRLVTHILNICMFVPCLYVLKSERERGRKERKFQTYMVCIHGGAGVLYKNCYFTLNKIETLPSKALSLNKAIVGSKSKKASEKQ